jgi:putative peptidoglycan lipid II flippase
MRKRSAAIVSLAVMGSRVFGLVREQVFAAMFGAGMLLDSYLAAFRIPNLLRDLFAEGALSTAFTTTFTKVQTKEGDDSAWHLARLVITALILILGTICVIGILASGPLVWVLNSGFEQVPGKLELTTRLTRILFPFILFVSLAAVAMGMLNAKNVFGLPASASTAFNIVSVLFGVFFAYLFDPQKNWLHPHFTERALYGVCLGVLMGGLAQLLIQMPKLWQLGFHYRWKLDFNDPQLRIVMALMLPSVIAGSAVQVNVMVSNMFASHINGAQSWLSCAFRLMQFPIGVFGVAIATVALPSVSRQHAQDNLVGFGKTVEEALRLAFYLTLPASIGLAVLSEPIIHLIYQHGRFNAEATHQTALALQAYSIGLAGYAGIKVLVPCFYALNQSKTPVRISLFGMVLNLGLCFLLVKGLKLGHVGLAMTTGLIALINFLQLLFFMSREVHCGRVVDWTLFFIKVTAACLACGAVAWFGMVLSAAAAAHGFLMFAVAVGLTVLLAATTYFGVTWQLGLPESVELIDTLRRKLQIGVPPQTPPRAT